MRGFPAAEQMLVDARPLLAQLDPATAQLTPAVDFIGLHKRELTTFFANTASATQAKDPGSTLHYLRTTNPFNPENLAVYPKRLPSNRPNPYRLPGGFDELPGGLPVYEDRQCRADNLVPTVTNTPLPIDAVPTVVPTAVPTIVPPGTLPVPIPPVDAAADPAGAAHARAGGGADPGRSCCSGSRSSRSAAPRTPAWSRRRRAASRGRSSSAASARSIRTCDARGNG